MKTKEQMVQEAIQNLRNHKHLLAADKLEKAIEKGTIDLSPTIYYYDRFIYAALVFAGLIENIEIYQVYRFETK